MFKFHLNLFEFICAHLVEMKPFFSEPLFFHILPLFFGKILLFSIGVYLERQLLVYTISSNVYLFYCIF